MSALFTRPTASVIIEFTENAVHIADNARAVELPLERDPAGTITPVSSESVRNALQSFAARSGQRDQAFCLLPARGVSLRRIALPASSKTEVERLLPLQIDAQFPLSSEELAWGYTYLGSGAPAHSATLQQLIVAAVKKDSLQPYRDLINSAGFEPLFAIAALARPALSPTGPPKFGVVEIGSQKSELLTFDETGPATLRVLALGADNSTSAEPLLETLRNNGEVQKLYVSGKGAAIWSQSISPGMPAEPLPVPPGQSAAIAGLRETLRRGHEPLLIHANRESVNIQRAPAQWRWAAAVVVLLSAYLALRMVEPIVRRTQLNRDIARLQTARDQFPKIDREVSFLQFIKTNQPAYIDLIATLAGASPPGTKFESVSISRHGDVALRGTAQNGQQAGTIRAKMFESGYFSAVVMDEMTPIQNQQQVNFRMTARLRAEPEPKPQAQKSATPTDKKAATNAPPVNATNSAAKPTNAVQPQGQPQPANP